MKAMLHFTERDMEGVNYSQAAVVPPRSYAGRDIAQEGTRVPPATGPEIHSALYHRAPEGEVLGRRLTSPAPRTVARAPAAAHNDGFQRKIGKRIADGIGVLVRVNGVTRLGAQRMEAQDAFHRHPGMREGAYP